MIKSLPLDQFTSSCTVLFGSIGPSAAAAASVLQGGVRGDLSEMKFMTSAAMDVYSITDCVSMWIYWRGWI